jgi:hypothetical protein
LQQVLEALLYNGREDRDGMSLPHSWASKRNDTTAVIFKWFLDLPQKKIVIHSQSATFPSSPAP